MSHFLSPVESTTIPILEKVVGFAQSRHTVLVGNLANADTPGYRVRDLSRDTFQERLKEVIDTRNTPYATSADRVDHYDSAMREVNDSMRTLLFHDKSDVGLEQQVLEISKNRTMHNMAIAIMQNQFALLNVAISERISE
jgi:flagellar basal-body rod protein FlgB